MIRKMMRTTASLLSLFVFINIFATYTPQAASNIGLDLAYAESAASPVVHLPFDGSVANIATSDVVTKVVGTLPPYVSGKSGMALQLDTDYNKVSSTAPAPYVDLGNHNDLKFETDTNFSIAFWFKFPSLNHNKGWPVIINNKAGKEMSGWQLITDSSNTLRWQMTAGDYQFPELKVYKVLDTDWHHLAISIDRKGAAKFFIDSVQQDVEYFNSINDDPLQVAAALDLADHRGTIDTSLTPKIGVRADNRLANTTADILHMYMDELRIYRHAISSEEVTAMMEDFPDLPEQPDPSVLDERFSQAIVTFIGNEQFYLNRKKQVFAIDEIPVRKARLFFAPTNFFAKTLNTEIIATAGVQTITINGIEEVLEGPVLEENGVVLVPLEEVSKKIGKTVYTDVRGLIVISSENILVRDQDQALVHDLVKSLTPNIVAIKEELALVDDFTTDSSSKYTFSAAAADSNLASFIEWNTSGQALAPKNSGMSGLFSWKRDDQNLTPGSSASIDLLVKKGNDKGAGFKVGDYTIELTSYVEDGKGFYYLRDGNGIEWDLTSSDSMNTIATLLISRGSGEAANQINWIIQGGGLYGAGEFTVDRLPEAAPIGLMFRHGRPIPASTDVKISQFRIGVLPETVPAVHHAMLLPWMTKIDHAAFMKDYASLDQTASNPWTIFKEAMPILPSEGMVTQQEILAFKHFFNSLPKPSNNQINDLLAFGNMFQAVLAMGRLHEMTGDIYFLEKQLEFTDRILFLRNDPQTGVELVTGNREATWEHHMNSYYKNGEFVVSSDIAHAGPAFLLVEAANIILNDKTLWDKTVPDGDQFHYGSTYLERAEKYIEAAQETIDTYILKYYLQHNEADNLIRWPDDRKGHILTNLTEINQRGNYYAWNRQFITLAVMARTVDAVLELKKASDSTTERYDQVVKAQVDHFFRSATEVAAGPEGGLHWGYVDGHFAEDYNHGAVDIHTLMVMYNSGRYGITEAQMVKLANNVSYRMFKGTAIDDYRWAYYLNGSGRVEQYLEPLGLYMDIYPLHERLFMQGVNRARTSQGAIAAVQLLKFRADQWGVEAAGPLLDGIEIDGKQVNGFSPLIMEYQVPVTDSLSNVPTVTANGTGTIEVKQAESIADLASVSIADASGHKTVYKINFVQKSIPGTPAANKIPIKSAKASFTDYENNKIANTYDGRLDTSFVMRGARTIKYDLGSVQKVGGIAIARPFGDSRTEYVLIETSKDGTDWTRSYYGTNSLSGTGYEMHPIEEIDAQYIRLQSWGNTSIKNVFSDSWFWDDSAISDVEVYAPFSPVLININAGSSVSPGMVKEITGVVSNLSGEIPEGELTLSVSPELKVTPSKVQIPALEAGDTYTFSMELRVPNDTPYDTYSLIASLELTDATVTRTQEIEVVPLNVAFKKPAEQSSTFNDAVASRAVDGNTNGAWAGGSITHTDEKEAANKNQPWWQVDLEENFSIEQIELWNRTDECCKSRLTDFYVFVSDHPFNNESLKEVLEREDVWQYHYSGTVNKSAKVDVNKAGRYVRIQLKGTNVLSLAEVMVFARSLKDYADSVDLADMTVSHGQLTPHFDPSVTAYTVEVGSAQHSITVVADVADFQSKLTVEGARQTDKGWVVSPLATGSNMVSFHVSAENGESKTYKLNVIRAKTMVWPYPPIENVDPPLEGKNTSETIHALQGGTVSLEGEASIIIPAGVLAADSEISIAIMENEEAPAAEGMTRLSKIYEMTSSSGNTLKHPAAVELVFDSEKLENGFVPAVYYYSEAQERWIYVGGAESNKGKLSFESRQLHKFAVFAYKPAGLVDMEKHWSRAAIDRLVGMGIIKGYPDATFRPNNEVTRAEFVKLIVEAAGLSKSADQVRFDDADSIPQWAVSYMDIAVGAGLIQGYSINGAYMIKPNQTITRAEMAVILNRLLQIEATHTVPNMTDEHTFPNWAKSAVSAMLSEGLMVGYGDQTFRSMNKVTRAEAAQVIYRLLDKLVN